MYLKEEVRYFCIAIKILCCLLRLRVCVVFSHRHHFGDIFTLIVRNVVACKKQNIFMKQGIEKYV